MRLDELTVARIARYAAELTAARAQMDVARSAMRAAQQAEADALSEYCALHQAHRLDPEAVTVLTRDINGPLGKMLSGTVIQRPDANGQGGGVPWDPPAKAEAP